MKNLKQEANRYFRGTTCKISKRVIQSNFKLVIIITGMEKNLKSYITHIQSPKLFSIKKVLNYINRLKIS